MTLDQVRDLYDEYVEFYSYLTAELIKLNMYLGPCEHAYKHAKATALLDAAKDKSMNAAMRDAYVQCDEIVLAADLEFQYFDRLWRAQDERRRGASKVIERLWRELVTREKLPGREHYKPVPRNTTASGYRRLPE